MRFVAVLAAREGLAKRGPPFATGAKFREEAALRGRLKKQLRSILDPQVCRGSHTARD
jgi:hypothetical protein